MLRFILTAIVTSAPAIGSASTLFANCTFSQSVSAEVPFTGGAVTFKENAETLSVMIADEVLEDNRAMLVGNNGTANLYMTAGPFGISYSEGIHGGTVSVVTIYANLGMSSGKYPAAMVRTFNVAPPDSPIGSALPSLRVGSCQVERG